MLLIIYFLFISVLRPTFQSMASLSIGYNRLPKLHKPVTSSHPYALVIADFEAPTPPQVTASLS